MPHLPGDDVSIDITSSAKLTITQPPAPE